MEDIRVLSASQIVALLCYKPDEITGTAFINQQAVNEGKRIHSRLGFDQARIFSKYFFDPNEMRWYLINGCPDRIEDGKILELKTYGSSSVPAKIKRVGILQCQIYCWLTALFSWELWGYNTREGKLVKICDGNYDEYLVREVIQTAIKLKRKLERFRAEYEKMIQEVIK